MKVSQIIGIYQKCEINSPRILTLINGLKDQNNNITHEQVAKIVFCAEWLGMQDHEPLKKLQLFTHRLSVIFPEPEMKALPPLFPPPVKKFKGRFFAQPRGEVYKRRRADFAANKSGGFKKR
jgi:hypothetical protein